MPGLLPSAFAVPWEAKPHPSVLVFASESTDASGEGGWKKVKAWLKDLFDGKDAPTPQCENGSTACVTACLPMINSECGSIFNYTSTSCNTVEGQCVCVDVDCDNESGGFQND